MNVCSASRIALFIALFCAKVTIAAACNDQRFTVEQIQTGDTITVRDSSSGHLHELHLAMILAPSKPKDGLDPASVLSNILGPGSEIVARVVYADSTGRQFAVVRDAQGRNLNLEMVQLGAAWLNRNASSSAIFADYYPELLAAEMAAVAAERGLWGTGKSISRWVPMD